MSATTNTMVDSSLGLGYMCEAVFWMEHSGIATPRQKHSGTPVAQMAE